MHLFEGSFLTSQKLSFFLETLFHYSFFTDWRFSIFNYGFNYTGAEKWRETSSEDEYIFFIMRRNYKRMRGHKRSVYNYSLHVNNREIDQEKQNKTVAR